MEVKEDVSVQTVQAIKIVVKKAGEKEKSFCFSMTGKSSCITEEKGCICGCPVYAKMNLSLG